MVSDPHTTWTRDDLEALREGWDFEAKKAAGRDGTGALPRAFWETYSAMANTRGGQVVLGVKERADGSFELHGLGDPRRVEGELWNCLSDRGKVSVNLLGEPDVEHQEIEGHSILLIHVPRAARADRPVFLNGQWDEAYLRVGEGDRKMHRERARRMLADAEFDSRDGRLLPHYGLGDLDADSLKAYRNLFASNDPSHPWPALGDQDLLERLGAWRRDRTTGEEGLTTAGLLFFGQEPKIREVFPNYFVDYQERPVLDDVTYWSDRLVPDGKWSGNVFDFFRRAYPKLVQDLKVPFVLEQGLFRQDETPVHRAVREALVNTLIHADYEGRIPVQAVKSPEAFVFRNPGNLRVPVTDIRRGGTTDCRNRALQRMFMFVGAGEQAGSGFGRILTAWHEQHWQHPVIEENAELDTTTLRLSMVSLFPEDVIRRLQARFPRGFQALDEQGRLAMAMAEADGKVTNANLQAVTSVHPRDLTLVLQRLVGEGLLERHGERRGTWYTVASTAQTTTQTTTQTTFQTTSQRPPPASSGENEHEAISRVSQASWSPRSKVIAAILEACRGGFVSSRDIASRLNRKQRTIVINYLPGLVSDGRLELKDPANPKSPEQAYRTTEPSGADS